MEIRDYVRDFLTKYEGQFSTLDTLLRNITARPRPTAVGVSPTGDYFGIEVEVENLPGGGNWWEPIQNSGYWNIVEDGSLRNNGREFVSAVLSDAAVPTALDNLFSNIPNKAVFHSRAGIHIHVDFSERTLGTLLNFLMVYFTIEPLLFNTLARYRRNNVFCVPTVDSFVVEDLLCLGKYGREAASKYCALNVLPLWKQGTIEFRHFESTKDTAKILRWVKLIQAMLRYAEKHNNTEKLFCEILELRTSSDFLEYLSAVLGHDTELFGFLVGMQEYKEIARQMNGAISTIAYSLYRQPMPVGSALLKYFR